MNEEEIVRRELSKVEAWRAGMSYDDYLAQSTEHQLTIARRVDEMVANREAKKLLRQLLGEAFREPLIETLEEALARPQEPVVPRIDHMMVVGHNTNIAATYKAGKTTLLVNRVRSYVDGVPFLGSFKVTPIDGRVVIFNYEVSDNQFLSWLDRVGIKDKDAVVPVNLRGKNFFLQSDDACEWAIKVLRDLECEVWEIDPLSAAIMGNTKDEEVASDFISRIERIKAEAGVSDLVLTTHTGHLSGWDSDGRAQNERTAGSARFMGWPDSLWTYTKDKDENRYLSVLGRDVECEEFQVVMDPDTKILQDQGRGTSRIGGKDQRAWRQILVAVSDNPGVKHGDLAEVAGVPAKIANALRDKGIEMGVFDSTKAVTGTRGKPPMVLTMTPLGQKMLAQMI